MDKADDQSPPAVTAELVDDRTTELEGIQLSYLNELSQLTPNKQRTLVGVVANVLSEDSKTEGELATLCGVSRPTLWKHRQDPLWGQCLTTILGDIVKGTSDRAIKALFKRAEHDTAAIKVWLNMADLWMDKTARLNVNTNAARAGQNVPFIDTVDDVLTLIGSAGWTIERLTDRFNLLKREGAF